MITFSKNAKKEILKTLNSAEIPEHYFLRVGVKGGSCSASFVIGLDKKNELDELHVIDEVPVIINKNHLMFVVGAYVDYLNEEEKGYYISR